MRDGDHAVRLQPMLALASLGLFFVSGLEPFADPDMWHGMSLAREAIARGSIPFEDSFAYTPTVYPVVHHEWGAGIILYLVTARFGAAGVLTLKYVLVAVIAAGAFTLARRRGTSLAVFCPAAFIAVFLSWIGLTTLRAQVYTLLFIVVLLHGFEIDRSGNRRWLAWWIPLHLLWVNLHAGFVVGLILFLFHGVEQALRRRPVGHLASAWLALILLITCNPYGIHYYSYLARAIPLDRSLITEWAPLWTAWPPIIIVYAMSLVLAVYALWRLGPRGTPGLLLVFIAAGAALKHQRHLSIHAAVWTCLVPPLLVRTRLGEMLERWWERPRAAFPVWALALALGLAAAAVKRPWELRIPANPGDRVGVVYPVGAVAYLQDAGFRGNLFVPFTVGAFVTWKLHPGVKVSIDGRYEAAYPAAGLEENHRFYNAEDGWREELTRYPTDAALVPKTRRVSTRLRQEESRGQGPRWSLIYEDDVFELYARPGLELPRRDRRGERLAGTFP